MTQAPENPTPPEPPPAPLPPPPPEPEQAPRPSQPRYAPAVSAVLLAVVLVLYAAFRPGSPPRSSKLPGPTEAKTPEVDGGEKNSGLRVPPSKESVANVGHLGALRVSDDAAAKAGAFWLEQEFKLPQQRLPGDAVLCDLYLTLNAATADGVRLRVKPGQVLLEKLRTVDGKPLVEELRAAEWKAEAAPTMPGAKWDVLGALWKDGTLGVWLNGREVLSWKGEADLRGPSAAAALPEVVLGARRAFDAGTVAFRDGFMADVRDLSWRPWSGKWELTQLAFPERSANPFSLRASFGEVPPETDPLYDKRLRNEDYGIGVYASAHDGTLKIHRITGGSPAAQAGLQEEDSIVEIDGRPIGYGSMWQGMQQLQQKFGEHVRLKVLRPGEPGLLEFNIRRDLFKWGTPLVGHPLEPADGAAEALVAGGEAGWSDYAAEAACKPLGSGGFGLAIALTSPGDGLLLRWIGPAPRAGAADPEEPREAPADAAREKLQLVRLENGKQTVLAETPLRYRPYEFYRLGLDWRGEDVTARVDGVEVLRKQVPGLKRGRVGLYAMKGEPVFFDDVTVATDRAWLDEQHRPQRRINGIFAQEQDMESWANPALEWKRDIATGWAVHTSRFPGEQVVVLKDPKFDALDVRMLTMEKFEAWEGASFRIKDGKASFELRVGERALGNSEVLEVGKGPIRRIVLRAGQDGAEADIDGKRLSWQGHLIIEGSAFDHVAIHGLKNLGDPQTVRVASSGTWEYTFNEAPADWQVACGRWGLLNKWICDPRWSWFGGRSETLATIWNKRSFGGDVSVDAYVALFMQRDDPPYERAGDYNITICGDGARLDRGYTVVVGGGGNYWTRLYRDGVLVAEATDEQYRMPSDRIRQLDKPELHQRWFHLRLEKIGGEVAFYRDGAKAFAFADPQPLKGGRVGFWTLDNGVLLSRCRIACTGEVTHAPVSSRAEGLYDDGAAINLFDGEVHTAVAREALPGTIAAALAAPPDGYASAEAEKSSAPPAGDAAAAWRVVNGIGGGAFALQMRRPFDNLGVLRFAMRIEPGAAVDFCLKDLRDGAYYRWRIAGPGGDRDPVPLVDTIPGVPADGKWHTVQFDLERSWNAYWVRRGLAGPPSSGGLRPLFACLDNGAYALAGFGCNAPGAAYAVSGLKMFPIGAVDKLPPKLKSVGWPFDAGGDGRSVRFVFDDPGGSGIDPGTLQIDIGGQAVPFQSVAFDEATQTASVDLLAARRAQPLTEGEVLTAKLGAAADRAGNAAEGSSESTWTFRMQAAFNARRPMEAPAVRALLDTDGQGARERLVRPPEFEGLRYGDVRAVAGVQDMEVATVPEAPPWARPNAKRSLEVRSRRDGAHLGFSLLGASYDLGQWPYLQLDYRVPKEVPVNLHFRSSAGRSHTLLLNDTGEVEEIENRRQPRGGFRVRMGWNWDRTGVVMGPPADFADDGTWRRSEIPLLKLFDAQASEERSWQIDRLDFSDGGWRGNRLGMRYWVHAVRALPAARSRGIAFSWTAQDLAGIADFAACVDQKPDTVPQGQGIKPLETVEAAFTRARLEAGQGLPPEGGMPDGWYWLHVRVKSGAGLWSPPAHYKFRIDNSAPRVVGTEPGNGAQLAGQTFRVMLQEDHAIRPDTLKVQVNGQAYTAGEVGVAYDPGTQTLTFDATETGGLARWADGETVNVRVYGAADCMGNTMAAPYAFSFVANSAKDRQGPAIAQVRFAAPDGIDGGPARPLLLELSMALDFEETLGHVRALKDCELEWTDDAKSAAFGRRAVRIVSQEDDADVEVMLHKTAWYVDAFPVLMFDYKAEGGVAVDLQVLALGTWYTIPFLGKDDGAKPGGLDRAERVAGAEADGTWRHATVDLRAALDRMAPALPVRIVSQVILSAHGRPGCKRGGALWLDNLALSPDMGLGGRLEWTAADDPSGIAGYSLVIDRIPDTEAPQTVTTRLAYSGDSPPTGTCYAHIRAVDQAGNWGPTRHFRMDF